MLPPLTTVIVEDNAAWEKMLDRLLEESVIAVDTETVGNGFLEKFELAQERRKDLTKAALAHCAKFPRRIGIHPKIEYNDKGRLIPAGNDIKGAKTSLAGVIRVRKDIDKLMKAAQSDPGGLRFWDCSLGCFQLGLRDGTCYAIRPQKFSREQWAKLGKILNHPRKTLLLQNAVFDIKMIYTHCGFLLDGRRIFDTKLAGWMLTNGENTRTSLKALAKKYLELDLSKDKAVRVSNWLGPWSKKQVDYALMDVLVLFPLYDRLRQEIFSWGLKRAFRLRCEFTTVAALLDMSGLPINVEGFKGFRDRLDKKMKYLDMDIRIQGKCDDDFNPNSPSQVYDMLARHGIEVDDTNEKTLKKSAFSGHPLIESILDYREVAKMIGYVDKYIDWSRDGRMYSQFHIDGTHTGRLSSGSGKWDKDPYYTNAQNPPKGEFRTYIEAPPGRTFIQADYSQIEIRWMARFSRDPVMLLAYQNNEDLHRLTAMIISGLTEEQFSALPEEKQKEYRQKAKAVNFGVLFGAGAKTLVDYAKMNYDVILTEEEALKIIQAWRKKYPQARQWQIFHPKRVQEERLVRTASGFIRFFGDNYYKHFPEGPYTDALNTPIQGSAADGMLNAMCMLVYNLLDDGYEPFVDFWLPTVVHDEIILECPEQYAEDFKQRIVTAMVAGMEEFIVSVPVEVEPKIVKNWQEAK